MISGEVSAAAGGFSVGGSIGLRINTTTQAIDETITLGSHTLRITFSDSEVAANGSPFFQLFGADLSLNIADFVTIEGNVSFTNLPAATPPQRAFAGSGLSIFLGRGPAMLAGGGINPTATGLLLSNATLGLIEIDENGTKTYALDATGTVQLLGINGIVLTGTARIRVNNTGQIISQTLTIPGTDRDVLVMFPTTDLVTSFEARNLLVSVLGQTLNGDFTFDKQTTPEGVVILMTAANVGLSLGDAASPIVQVTNGSGVLRLGGAGVAGVLNAGVAVNLPGVTLGGTYELAINSTPRAVTFTPPGATDPVTVPAGPFLRVAGNGASLNVLGQTLNGNFAFERVTHSTARRC